MENTSTNTEVKDTPKRNFKTTVWVVVVIVALLGLDNRYTHYVSGGAKATTDSTSVAKPVVDTTKVKVDTTKKLAVDTIKKVVVKKDTVKKK